MVFWGLAVGAFGFVLLWRAHLNMNDFGQQIKQEGSPHPQQSRVVGRSQLSYDENKEWDSRSKLVTNHPYEHQPSDHQSISL